MGKIQIILIFMSVCLFNFSFAQELKSTDQAQVLIRQNLSGAQARQFLSRFEDSLSQWSLEDAAGAEAISDEQIAETKNEICKLINVSPCDIHLPSQDGSAILNNDLIVVGEIRGVGQKKSAVISLKENQVTFYNQPQNNYYQQVQQN